MEKTKTPESDRGIEAKSKAVRSNGMILVVSALDMSWRLAIAVLVPIIGGFELDKHFNTLPALTIVGFLLAMAGLFFILKHTVAQANEKFKGRPR